MEPIFEREKKSANNKKYKRRKGMREREKERKRKDKGRKPICFLKKCTKKREKFNKTSYIQIKMNSHHTHKLPCKLFQCENRN